MQWCEVLTIIGANIAVIFPLFLWLRSEANADRRDILSLVREIQAEMKDFHGRLCSLAARQPKTDP